MAPEREIVDLSDESIRKLAFEMGKAFMLPPKKHEADNERAGKALVGAFQFNSAAFTWYPFVLVAPAGDTRIQVFDANLWSIDANTFPFLCFFKNPFPVSIADATILANLKPSDSVALQPYGFREILRGDAVEAVVNRVAAPTPLNYKGQSGLSNPGEGLAVIFGQGVVSNFGADHYTNVTFRSIIDVR